MRQKLYRAAAKLRAKELGITLDEFRAREKLALWARTGGHDLPKENYVLTELKQPAPEGTPHFAGEVGAYDGVCIHGRR